VAVGQLYFFVLSFWIYNLNLQSSIPVSRQGLRADLQCIERANLAQSAPEWIGALHFLPGSMLDHRFLARACAACLDPVAFLVP